MCIWIVVVLLSVEVQAQIAGRIQDIEGNPLPLARVFLLPDSLYQLSDTSGRFAFGPVAGGRHELIISSTGYETLTLPVEVPGTRAADLTCTLAPRSDLVGPVVITEEHAKQEAVLPTTHLGADFFRQRQQSTLAAALERLPGIAAINVGVGISKPVIRGLAFQRIIVNDLGLKQEGQQWGADHGLEVDPFAVSRVEVIKGPATLQYGSDGLGGVINLMPEALPQAHRLEGSVQSVYRSNNQHLGTSAHVSVSGHQRWLSVRASTQTFGDYRVPVDSFAYQGYLFPLYDGYLKNTAGRERGLHVQAGQKGTHSITRLTYRGYGLEAGLFPGATGAPRSYTLLPDSSSRDIDLPGQSVAHHKVLLNHTHFFDQHHFDLNIGYQRNLRREFAFPEYHNQPGIDRSNTTALQLDLHTLNANAHWEQHLADKGRQVVGVNGQYQRNSRAGWEFLLPDFQSSRAGVFVLREQQTGPRLRLSGGARLDYGHNRSEAFGRYVWDSNAQVIDSLGVPAVDTSYVNWSASLGAVWELRPQQWLLKAHAGRSFRIPHPVELVSNGVHHGTFRHEQGTPTLGSERGYQFDLRSEWQATAFSAALSAYFNYFRDFICLRPTARFSSLPEAGQIYQYTQTDAIYTGFEAEWSYSGIAGLEAGQSLEYVYTYNLASGLAMPFTPPGRLWSRLRYTRAWGRADLSASIDHQWVLAAGQVDRNEATTPGYQLVDVGAGVEWPLGGERASLQVQVQNLFDVYYLKHLSRYRLINIPEQGRNVVVSLELPLGMRLAAH
ncbi:MAG: TonB-dependent receptor [Bacteroidia bacterium]